MDVIASFYRRGNQDTESQNNLPKVTQLEICRAMVWTHISDFKITAYGYCVILCKQGFVGLPSVNYVQ